MRTSRARIAELMPLRLWRTLSILLHNRAVFKCHATRCVLNREPNENLVISSESKSVTPHSGQATVTLPRSTFPWPPDKWFPEACEAAKVPNFTWHCVRHTFATRSSVSP